MNSKSVSTEIGLSQTWNTCTCVGFKHDTRYRREGNIQLRQYSWYNNCLRATTTMLKPWVLDRKRNGFTRCLSNTPRPRQSPWGHFVLVTWWLMLTTSESAQSVLNIKTIIACGQKLQKRSVGSQTYIQMDRLTTIFHRSFDPMASDH